MIIFCLYTLSKNLFRYPAKILPTLQDSVQKLPPLWGTPAQVLPSESTLTLLRDLNLCSVCGDPDTHVSSLLLVLIHLSTEAMFYSYYYIKQILIKLFVCATGWPWRYSNKQNRQTSPPSAMELAIPEGEINSYLLSATQ